MVEAVKNQDYDAEAAVTDSHQDMRERRGQASRGTGKSGTANSGMNKGRAKPSTDKLSQS